MSTSVGGWTQVDVFRPTLSLLLENLISTIFAQLRTRIGIYLHHTSMRVIELQQQVVNGMNYQVTLRLEPRDIYLRVRVHVPTLADGGFSSAIVQREGLLIS